MYGSSFANLIDTGSVAHRTPYAAVSLLKEFACKLEGSSIFTDVQNTVPPPTGAAFVWKILSFISTLLELESQIADPQPIVAELLVIRHITRR